jgi:CheY-like chemotaxis protein
MGGVRSTGDAPRILLVDDESAIRTICRFNLESDGLQVAEAIDGRQALEAARNEQPELILLDVMMPELDGWQVAAELAQDPALQDIPIVFLSARAAREDKARARELGAVGYIVKPFDPVALGAAVREILERVRRGERDELNRDLSHPE